MKRRMFVSAVATLMFGLYASLALAGEIQVDVQFQFSAGGEVFPAGKYKISTGDTTRPAALTIRSTESGKRSMVPFVTRLSRRSENQPAVVFDKQGDKYFLSEVYIAGTDGYQLKGAPADHSHVTVQGNAP